jgi:DNA (cytosine-5)-methyltransferase 1
VLELYRICIIIYKIELIYNIYHIILIMENMNITKSDYVLDLNKMSKPELLSKCKELGIKGISKKNMTELRELINKTNGVINTTTYEEIPLPIINTPVIEELPIYTNIENSIEENVSNLSLKFIDLFCGIGSFHNSFNKFGWECVMSCDIDAAVKQTYKENYNQEPLGDITKIEPEDIIPFDILCAGFPCQPFSQCGQHKGFDDERGTLFFNIMKFVKYHKPKIIILENVQGLLTHDNGNTFQTIKTQIEIENYVVGHKVLKCSDYGIPQMRKRLFIIGIRNDLDLKNKINNILNFKEYEKNVSLSTYMGKHFEKEIAYTIRCGGKHSPIHDKHNWDGYIVNGVEYRLTIEDCLKLQGFDSSFKLKGNIREQWKQLGNTIPTIFTHIIGNNINKFYS